jgi:hypothetical protein
MMQSADRSARRIQTRSSPLNNLISQNVRFARRKLSATTHQIAALKRITEDLNLSIILGELVPLEGNWYVTDAGLLRLARRHRCSGIRTQPLPEFCDPAANRWVFKATVYKTPRSKGFVGYGDADPSNVSSLVRGAEMRVAETRAVNRALRKAYGIGLCSVEELGSFRSSEAEEGQGSAVPSGNGSSSNNGQPRLRDRLCQLIRQHKLDPSLVKRYAADFCGTATLRDASRELVADFVRNLAEWAAKDRTGLLCHLNSYSQPKEVKP